MRTNVRIDSMNLEMDKYKFFMNTRTLLIVTYDHCRLDSYVFVVFSQVLLII